MKDVALTQPVFIPKRPLNISTARIDRATGLLTYQTNYTTRFEYFKNGTIPKEYAQNNNAVEDNIYEQENSETSADNYPTSEDDLF